MLCTAGITSHTGPSCRTYSTTRSSWASSPSHSAPAPLLPSSGRGQGTRTLSSHGSKLARSGSLASMRPTQANTRPTSCSANDRDGRARRDDSVRNVLGQIARSRSTIQRQRSYKTLKVRRVCTRERRYWSYSIDLRGSTVRGSALVILQRLLARGVGAVSGQESPWVISSDGQSGSINMYEPETPS